MERLTGALGFALAIALSQTSAQSAGAQPHPPAATSPDTSPAALQGRRLLDAVTRLDDGSFLKVLHEVYPASKMTDAAWLEARRNWKQFEFHSVEQSSRTQAELSVFDAGREDWVKVIVTVEEKPPYAITDFGVRAGRRLADVPPAPKLEPEALVSAVSAYASREAAEDHFSGVVLISRRGRLLTQNAYGLADRERRKPIRLDTKLRVGSMGKMFTTVAVLQLAQSGRLDLNATVGRYLPDYPNREIATTVTVDELLNHAGGTGDFFGPEFDAHGDRWIDPKDYIAALGDRPALFPAGSQQAYSNFGFVILGRIVETVSGESYDDYVRRHIFEPAMMSGSGFLPENVDVASRAVGYTQTADGLTPATKNQVYRGTPAGGGYSTGPDLIRFADALMGGRLLNPKFLDRLTATGTRLPNGTAAFYDFGGRHTADGQLYFGHGGAAPGQNGVLHILPDSGYTIVVLANRDPAISERIAKFIEARIP